MIDTAPVRRSIFSGHRGTILWLVLVTLLSLFGAKEYFGRRSAEAELVASQQQLNGLRGEMARAASSPE